MISVAAKYRVMPLKLLFLKDKRFKTSAKETENTIDCERLLIHLLPTHQKDIPSFNYHDIDSTTYKMIISLHEKNFNQLIDKLYVLYWGEIEPLLDRKYKNTKMFLADIRRECSLIVYNYICKLYTIMTIMWKHSYSHKLKIVYNNFEFEN